MKKLTKYEVGVLASIPVIYVIAYFAFLTMANPSASASTAFLAVAGSATTPVVLTSDKSVTIVTGNVPLGQYAVDVFRPAIEVHRKLTGKQFVIKFHELA